MTIDPTPPAAAIDEHRIADLEPGGPEQAQMRGHADQRRRGDRFVGHARRRGIQPALVDRAVLGKRALAAHQALVRAPHAIADAEPRRVRPRAATMPARSQPTINGRGNGQ